jgi:hypothetical protein
MSKTHAKEAPARTEGEANHTHINIFQYQPEEAYMSCKRNYVILLFWERLIYYKMQWN